MRRLLAAFFSFHLLCYHRERHLAGGAGNARTFPAVDPSLVQFFVAIRVATNTFSLPVSSVTAIVGIPPMTYTEVISFFGDVNAVGRTALTKKDVVAAA